MQHQTSGSVSDGQQVRPKVFDAFVVFDGKCQRRLRHFGVSSCRQRPVGWVYHAPTVAGTGGFHSRWSKPSCFIPAPELACFSVVRSRFSRSFNSRLQESVHHLFSDVFLRFALIRDWLFFDLSSLSPDVVKRVEFKRTRFFLVHSRPN